MSEFEAQCDCELDSPGTLSHLPVEERLQHWMEWALYLKTRIETHYRPELKRAEAALIVYEEANKSLSEAKERAEATIADLEERLAYAGGAAYDVWMARADRAEAFIEFCRSKPCMPSKNAHRYFLARYDAEVKP